MKIVEKKEDLRIHLEDFLNNKSIGFVPTMGALHEGHLSLISRAKKENDIVVCSIFVNPIQFNNKEDLKKYPRTMEADIEKLESVKCDLLFAPDENEMYPENNNDNDLDLDFGEMDKVMEGYFRPGHFKGVAIVVNKLFGMVRPARAYFGEKDYQQLAIIKKMVSLLKSEVKIISCKTIREIDGLAMSSRNIRLTDEERKEAPFIYEILKKARELKKKSGVDALKKWVEQKFLEKHNFRLEYFEIADAQTLKPLYKWDNKNGAVACIAAYLGNVRLIDNIKLEE